MRIDRSTTAEATLPLQDAPMTPFVPVPPSLLFTFGIALLVGACAATARSADGPGGVQVRLARTEEDQPRRRMPMADGLAPLEAATAMSAPPGFSVKLLAAEPDVRQPIAMCFDDRGRLWVAECYAYPRKVAAEDARDRILVFEDTDGDHVPDGEPTILLDGWGAQDTHETLNSFIWGPDGWLYGCHGVFTHSAVGKPGTPEADRTRINAGIWRYHPVRHVFEVFSEGTSNPWGVDFNDLGHAFQTACVIPHLYHVIQGGRYQRQAGQHFNPFSFDDIKTIARHRHWTGGQWHDADRELSDAIGGGHAHSGACIYLGGVWPDRYRGRLFMNNIHGARINEDRLTPAGSGYVGDGEPDFLFANDSWSQFISLQVGPDGQMVLIDWYDRNQCRHRDDQTHDRGNGRIFKVLYDRAAPAPVKVNLARDTDATLVDLLGHDNDWFVRHARRLLHERAAAGRLVAHAEDAEDHNLPLMNWYAIEPLVPLDAARALALAAASRIPTVSRFVIRRAASDEPCYEPLVAPRVVPQLRALLANRDADRKADFEKWRTAFKPAAMKDADLSRGRATFAKTCGACHQLHGQGGRIGPDLTGSNRSDLEYLLANLLDPSAVVGRDYQTTIVVTDDGRSIAGIVVKEAPTSVTLQTPTEQVTVPLDDIESRVLSPQSLMPENQLSQLSPTAARDLVAYLRHPSQVPLPGEGPVPPAAP